MSTPENLLTPRRTARVLLFLLAAGALLRLDHLGDVRWRTPDERTYTYQAHRLLANGFGDFPLLVREYNRNPALYVYPIPTRVGYLALLTGMMELTGVTDERAGAWLSCLVSVASLALFGLIAFRFLPPWPAIYSMLYLALSYPDLAVARRSWQDAVMGGLGMLLVWCACEIARDHRQRWAYAIFVGAGSFFVLVKELGVFVYAGCAIYVVLLLLRSRAWPYLGGLLLGGLAGAGLSAWCLVSGAGGLQPLLEAWGHFNDMAKDNPYMDYQNGPWSQLIHGFWILGPVNLLLSSFALGLALLPKRQLDRLSLPFSPMDIRLLRFFSWITALLAITILVLANAQNFRYLAAVYGSMYLMGGFGLWAFWRLATRHASNLHYQALTIFTASVILAGAIASYQDFAHVFVKEDVADLSIKMVIDSRR